MKTFDRTIVGLLLWAGIALAGIPGIPCSAAEHPADGPQILHVGPVAPDILMLTIQSGVYTPGKSLPYVAQAGDQIIEKGKDDPKSPAYQRPVVLDDKLVHQFELVLKRGGKNIGMLSPDRKSLMMPSMLKGTLLNADAAGKPGSFQIQSADDKAYTRPTTPVAVYRKCKPNGPPSTDEKNVAWFPFVHYVSLKIPSPLVEGASYTIELAGVNTAKDKVVYKHAPRMTRSDAVHATQVGYGPDDGCKRAYLSIWLGADAGGQGMDVDYSKIDSFELVDADTGKTVYTGKPVATKKKGDIDAMGGTEKNPDLDLSLAAVQRLDFSDFKKPGEYCVYVPGIGRSGPFRIARNVWEEPFRAAMHAILCQRSGIELKAPYAQLNRPSNFREEDGTQFYQISITEMAGQEGARGKDMVRLFNEGKLKRVHGIWGAHEDAGDWDTLTHHMGVPYRLFELYDMFPDYFNKIKLPLPEDEAAGKIPHILAEGIWMLDGFKRLQLPDGGVRGGYGNPWGEGENFVNMTSWTCKSICVYAANPATSYYYAACAARAARVLAKIDPAKAGEYRESALRAWDWAEKTSADPAAMASIYGPTVKGKPWDCRLNRMTASAELYQLTLDPKYSAALKEDNIMRAIDADLLFAIARAPEGLLGPERKRKAVELFTAWADRAIEYSKKNGFDIIAGRDGMGPVNSGAAWLAWFSTPGTGGGINLARVAYLTKDPKHVAAVVQSCNYSFGANPMNFSYMAGVGWNSLQFPFKVDRRAGGLPQAQPRGYIPFGFQTYISWWALARIDGKWNPTGPRMFPEFKDWPMKERFIDWATDPNMNETVVDSQPLTAAYITGFLMAREAEKQ